MARSWNVVLGVFILTGLALSGCSKGSPEKQSAPPEPRAEESAGAPAVAAPAPLPGPTAGLPAGQWYRGYFDLDDFGEMPFFLLIPADATKDVYVVNGDEVVPANHAWDGATLELTFRINYVPRISATRADDGTLRGEFTREWPLWGKVQRDFRAEPVDAPDPRLRFPGAVDATPVDLAGVWRFEFEHHGEGKGRFEQKGDGVVHGFLRPGWLGDLRSLSGNVRGNQLMLSVFNGVAMNFVKAEISPDGKRMTGAYSAFGMWTEEFTATKVADEFEPELSLQIKKKRLSQPALKPYQGKPVVLIYFATWCPTCEGAMPFFRELHERYADKGVAFLSLAYELSEDEKANEEQVRHYRERHNLSWEIKQVPITPEEWGEKMVPEIEGWHGFPVIVFIRRDGTVHATYTGWTSPADPRGNEKLKAQVTRWVDEIGAP